MNYILLLSSAMVLLSVISSSRASDLGLDKKFNVALDQKQQVQFLQHRLNKYFEHISNSRKLLSEIAHATEEHDQDRLMEMLDQSMKWTAKEKTFFQDHGIDLDLDLTSPESEKLHADDWKRINDIFGAIPGNMNHKTASMDTHDMLKTHDKLLENMLLEHSRMFETQRNPNSALSQELLYLFSVKKALHGKLMKTLLS